MDISEADFTVIVLQGNKVLINECYRQCILLNQQREVQPQYGMSYANWGQATSQKVVEGSETLHLAFRSTVKKAEHID